MAIFKKLIIFLVVFAVVVVGLFITAPLYLPALLSELVPNNEIRLNHIRMRVPTLSHWVIPELELQTAMGDRVIATNVIAHYDIGELLQGKLQGIDIQALDVSFAIDKPVKNTTAYRLPAIDTWVAAMPFTRLSIDEGSIDQKLTLDRLDLQKYDNTLVLISEFQSEQESVRLTADLSPAGELTIALVTNRGQFVFAGDITDMRIKGEGEGQIDISVVKPWLPQDLKNLQGNIDSKINITLFEQNEILQINASAKVTSDLQSTRYFDHLQIAQSLAITGPAHSPSVILLAGDSVNITNLHNPVVLKKATVALSKALIVDKVLGDVNVPEATSLQIRTDRDVFDVDISGKHLAIRGNVASVDPGMQLTMAVDVNSLSPVHLNILSGATVTVNTVDAIGKTELALTDTFSLIENQQAVALVTPLKFSVKNAWGKYDSAITGDLTPLKLAASVSTHQLTVDNNQYGPAKLDLTLQGGDQFLANFTAELLGATIRGNGSYAFSQGQGAFTADLDRLSQLNDYFAKQCVAISRGSLHLTGSISGTTEPTLAGTIKLENFNFKLQETPFTNIQFRGQWQTSFTGDGAPSLTGQLIVPNLNAGLEIDNLIANLKWQDNIVYVDSARGDVLGGQVKSENQRWRLDQPRNQLLLTLQEIDLKKLVSLEESSGVDVSGRINATLPLVVDSGRVQVVGGKIEAVQPGGEIHLPVDGSNRTGAQKEAFEALQNFHYNAMTGGLSGPIALDPNGILVSQLTIRGSNPDLGRPVSLNLTIEQNTYPIFQTLELFNKINRIGQCSPQ